MFRAAITALFCTVVISVTNVAWAWADQEPSSQEFTKAVDALVKRWEVGDSTPGVAIWISHPGGFQFKKCYGVANLDTRAPITSKTMFELASVSKTFTAVAVLKLHERGELSIHDDIRKYLPELPDYGRDRPITIAHLLRHTSGLPNYMTFEDVPQRHPGYWVNEDYLPQFAKQQSDHPSKAEPGEHFEYNNTNFMLLASIIQRVTKKSYGTFMRDEVFQPASMHDTFVYESPKSVPLKRSPGCDAAFGYERTHASAWLATWGAPPLRSEELLVVGDGGIWSNLDDMAHWDAALRTHKLIKPATMKMALAPSKTTAGKVNTYGLGWMVYRRDTDGPMNGFGHEGSWGGFRTSYYQHKVSDRTTVILANRNNFDTDRFWYPLNDLVNKHADK